MPPHFEAHEGGLKGYIGKSWTVWNLTSKEWKQTWVDNQGSYLDFEGAIVDGNPVFPEISEKAFCWDWENSTDDGKTWNLAWQIE